MSATAVCKQVEPRAAAFLDRDGVINVDLGHVHKIEDFEVLPLAAEGMRVLTDAGYALVVVTNQAGIAKDLYDEATYSLLTRYMCELLASQGIMLAGVYHCPHHPEGRIPSLSIECGCRKPAPGMLLRATAELGLDLDRSVMVGDKISDTQAARLAGVARTALVETGHPLPDDALNHADYRCADLLEAARWITGRI